MNTEINTALAILVLGLRQSRKTARPIRPNISIVIVRLPVEFVRNDRERDVIGAVKPAHDLEDRPSESGMTGRISGERRREVGASQIARRRSQRREVRI